jgi:hypothetical protein
VTEDGPLKLTLWEVLPHKKEKKTFKVMAANKRPLQGLACLASVGF